MIRFTALVILLSFFVLTSRGQPDHQDHQHRQLDSLFDALQQHQLAMGSIAISQNGHILYQRSTGYAQLDSNRKMAATSDSPYPIGSVTKMFTAALLFQLAEEKKLRLEDTLSHWFPQLPNARRITLRAMMYHRSGLPDFTKQGDYPQWKAEGKTHAQLLTIIAGARPDFEPGAKADYNNTNYLLLGYIIEAVCKKPYAAVVEDRIIRKLALTHTRYNAGEFASFTYFDGQWKKETNANLDNFGGAGAIVSTPTDLTRFMNALFSGRLISEASLHHMQSMVDGYGMGMFPYSFEGKQGFGHHGKTEGFATSLTYYPQAKLVIAYCTNGQVYPKSRILDAVLRICFDQPFNLPTFEPVILPAGELAQYVGTYVSAAPDITLHASVKDGRIYLETRGKVFALDALDHGAFVNRPFGFFFDFDADLKQLRLTENGDIEYYLHRQ